MTEEINQDEFTYVCKLCKKSFPNGKSLGGHMSYHARTKAQNFDEDDIETDDENDNVGAKTSKKRCRIVDNQEEIVCKQCGKVFKSLKALYGHMTVHSHKNNRLSQKANALAVNNTAAVTVTAVTASSSRRSEIEQYLELEEVAMCLMMLSRDCNNCLDFAVGSTGKKNTDEVSPEANDQNYSRKKEKQENSSVVTKKVKDFKCGFCSRVFKSGQALGGHQRKHTLGSKNVNNVPSASASVSPPSEPVVNQFLFDLNLPAPEDEEGSGCFSV